jgi:hypothetical protein
VYSIQQYVIKVVINLLGAGEFFPGFIHSTNKDDCHDLTEILLKVALNTLTLL